MFHKKKTYHMDMKSADTTLQNVFAACDQTPNSIPFDKLVLRQKARTKTFDILLIIISLVVILTILAPLPFLCFKESTVSSYLELNEHYVVGNKLYLVLDTNDQTIKYEEAYLLSPSGDLYEIISYDSQNHTLCFPYIAQECNIYIPYGQDSILHLLLTPNTTKENN